jgi:hypothetical protein
VGQQAKPTHVRVVVNLLLRISKEGIAAHPKLESDEETAERRLKNLYTSYQILISVKVAFIFIQVRWPSATRACISRVSPVHLPCISRASPVYLPTDA